MPNASAKTKTGRRIVLIGFMGAGKTTVGRALAKRLRWPFYDLDDLIERRERQSIPQIFASAGEPGFRAAESATLRELLQGGNAAGDLILALGGGAFVQARNRTLLDQAAAVTILLEAPLEELQRRCQSERKVRPLALEEQKFAELFDSRRTEYERARFRVQTAGKPVEQVAAEIEELLNSEVEK
jgi:shikimate kinase